MANYQWYVTPKRQILIDEVKKLPDGKDLSKVLEEALEDWYRKHGSGNPAYELTKWLEKPNFKAVPAFLTDYDKWTNFLANCNPQELKEFMDQAEHIQAKARHYLTEEK